MALRRADSASLALTVFKRKSRIVCNDKAGSNRLSERAHAHDRRYAGFGETALFDCEVHVAATIHAHVFRRIDDEVTGL
eukprot:1412072-Pyramimonas_sp.AAC.1